MVSKILTVGSAAGSISELFAKVKAIDAKHGKFDILLCIGDFFGPGNVDDEGGESEIDHLLDGRLEAPIECYIMQGEHPLPSRVVEKFATTGGELCKGIFLMSKSGVLTTANGLTIACLGGVYDPNIFGSAEAAPGFLSPFYSRQTIDRLLSNTLVNTSISAQKSYSSLASIQASASSSQLVDILLTNNWPTSIVEFSSLVPSDPTLATVGASPLNDVIRKLKPRYHFAARGGQPPNFWEREPYIWDEQQGRVSRFVSLGAFGGVPVSGKKPRWFYAFSMSPNLPNEHPVYPPNVSKNPFNEAFSRPTKRALNQSEENFIFGTAVQQPLKRSRVSVRSEKLPPGYKCRRCESTEHFINDCPERNKPPEDYICKICQEPGHFVRDCPSKDAKGDTGGRKPKPGYICRACGSEEHYLEDCSATNNCSAHGERRGRKRVPPKEISSDECWFCLSNPSLAKHLVVAIGTECYVTLPKGQIIPTQSAAKQVDVPGGGHVLIVPISHYPTYSTIPPDLAASINQETEEWKIALSSMYKKYGSLPVFFEVGRLTAKGGHAHIQAVPIPVRLGDRVEEEFRTLGTSMGIVFEEDANAADSTYSGGRGGYFKVDLPDGRKLVHLLNDHVPFSVQFGRQVLTGLLGKPERLDWKTCMLLDDEDRADAQEFKNAFTPYNPYK